MNIKDFLESMRNLAASVSIVSAQSQQKKNFAMTVSSVTSLSVDPPSLLVCVNKEASIHNILKIGSQFAVNILTKDHIEIANVCSSKDKEDQRFHFDNWELDNPPYIQDAQANIFCKVDKVFDYHTHSIVVGSVKSVLNKKSFNTLMYANGGYL
ncbi:MAG: flavin reductase family protein [Gammaproteobacteria bacterium]|jgi:flavin reductase (DIM6/NTAB) family NADH-FMN oxidoreductase RutF